MQVYICHDYTTARLHIGCGSWIIADVDRGAKRSSNVHLLPSGTAYSPYLNLIPGLHCSHGPRLLYVHDLLCIVKY